MSFTSQRIMQSENTTSINNMRESILMDVSKSVSNTLAPFMEKVKIADQQNTAIQDMLQYHPIYIRLVEENILLKKQIRSDSGNVQMNIYDSKDVSSVSVSDIYNEFGLVKKENTNLNQKKTVITSLPDGGSAISSKLVDFQKSLEETLIYNHELIEEFKTTFCDFLQNATDTDSESDTSSVEEVEPPKLKRQTVDLTNSWLSNTPVKVEPANLNDPIQARLALTSPSSSENEVKVKTEKVESNEKEHLRGVEEQETYFTEKRNSVENDEDKKNISIAKTVLLAQKAGEYATIDTDSEEDDEEEEDEEVEEEEVEDEEEEEEEEDEDEEDEDEDEDEEDEEDEEEEDEEDEEDEEEESDKEEKIPDKPRTVPSNEESDEDDEESDEEELYMMELEDDDGNALEYYCNDENEMNGDLFEILPDESVGPKIGNIKDGEIELFE